MMDELWRGDDWLEEAINRQEARLAMRQAPINDNNAREAFNCASFCTILHRCHR